MTPEELILQEEAFLYVRNHSKELIQKFMPSCIPVATPVSLFMAGSPGAGKTEVSKSLMRKFETIPVRIDADDIRAWCPKYVGAKAYVFQKAANKGVNILYDEALSRGCHMILDGTFAYKGASENIRRSINKNRKVEIWFVYQDPKVAWEFTKARESLEARNVPKEAFIKAFFLARENATAVKETFGNSLTLNLLVKNIDNVDQELRLNMQGSELDRFIGSKYTEDDLASLLHD